MKKDTERSKGLNETMELIKFHQTERPKPKVEEPKRKERKTKEKKKKKQPKEETFSSLFGVSWKLKIMINSTPTKK